MYGTYIAFPYCNRHSTGYCHIYFIPIQEGFPECQTPFCSGTKMGSHSAFRIFRIAEQPPLIVFSGILRLSSRAKCSFLSASVRGISHVDHLRHPCSAHKSPTNASRCLIAFPLSSTGHAYYSASKRCFFTNSAKTPFLFISSS